MTPVVIVTGSRDYPEYLKENIFKVLRELDPQVVVQGGARGADAIAKQWAEDSGRICVQFDADWERHGKAAGMIRNRAMLKEYPRAVVVAFPDWVGPSPGTRGCIKEAKLRRMDVRVYELF